MRHIYWSCYQNATATRGAGCTTATAGTGNYLCPLYPSKRTSIDALEMSA
jgi:hypothetical protein